MFFHNVLNKMYPSRIITLLQSNDHTIAVEDHRKFEDEPCKYGNWSRWSECEVVCQPVKKGSNKVRQKIPIEGQGTKCKILEEFYYCDPDNYC